MNNFNIQPDYIYQSIKDMQRVGCGSLYFENQEFDGRSLVLNNKEVINLANCSYLALEKHDDMIKGSQDALLNFGTQNSTSRNVFSNPLFQKAESMLSQIFKGNAVIFSSTTLAHYSALPLLVQENDAIILDVFVHNSIRIACELCRAKGTFVMVAKHNDMENLQYLVKRLKKEGFKNIWYCADGVYSTHGDFCNVKGVQELLDKEENFYAYVDDAHGVGWTGKNGSGFVIGNFGLHPKMIVAGSLSKSFAASGGFLIVPDEEIADYLKIRGNAFLFTIPMAPSLLGAINSSLELHLSASISSYQSQLMDIIRYFRKKCQENSIPVFSKEATPIQFIRIGAKENTIQLHKHLVNAGFFAPVAVFPGVQEGEGGLRFSITRSLTLTDIDNLVDALKKANLPCDPNEHNLLQETSTATH